MSRPKQLPPLKPATVEALHRVFEQVPRGGELLRGEPPVLCALKNADPLLSSLVAIVHFFNHVETQSDKTGGKFIRRGLPSMKSGWVEVFSDVAGAALAANDAAFFQQVSELLVSHAPHNGKPRLDVFCWMASLGRAPVKLSELRDSVGELIEAVGGGSARPVTSADVRDALRRLGIPWK